MKNNIKLKEWEKTTNQLANYFVKKYFGKAASHVYWVADCIGDIFCVNDYFFSIDDIIWFLRCDYTEEALFDYYDYRLTEQMKEPAGIVINIKNWRKLKDEKNKQ